MTTDVPDRPAGRAAALQDPDVIASLKHLWEYRTVVRVAGEGLRERKKRILRQQISDTATLMFLQRGFDEVKVSEIADECGVSEKTIYNYFPTKESLLFDKEQDLADQLADAFSDRTSQRSLVETAVAILSEDLDLMFDSWAAGEDPTAAMIAVQEFGALVERTPALKIAAQAMMERLTDVTASALAERAGVDPHDPEPQMAAAILMGLWRIQFGAMHRYAAGARTFDEVRVAVLDEIRRAARVADTGLSSFNLVLQQTSTKQQIQDAADAANEARRQVIAAVKQARAAWKHVAGEARAIHEADDQREQMKRDQRRARQEIRAAVRAHQQLQREQHAMLRQQQAESQAARRQRRPR